MAPRVRQRSRDDRPRNGQAVPRGTGILRVEVYEDDAARDHKVPGALVVIRGESHLSDGVAGATGDYEVRLHYGTYRVMVTAQGFGEWEQTVEHRAGAPAVQVALRAVVPPEPPLPPTPPATGLRGQVRRSGDVLVDDTGPVLPVGVHWGEAFSRFVRDPAVVEDQARALVGAGYHFARVWTNLDAERPGDYWWGREVTEDRTANYWVRYGEFLSLMRRVGLKVAICQGGWWDIRDHTLFARRLGHLVNEVGIDTAILFESCNEAWHPAIQAGDPAMLADFARRFLEVCPVPLVTLTSAQAEDGDSLREYVIPPATLYSIHLGRGDHPRHVCPQHVWTPGYEYPPTRFGYQSEPPGRDARISAVAYRDEWTGPACAYLAAMSTMTRQLWVHMTGAGVLFDTRLEDEPGWREVPEAVALLPNDVMSFQLVHGGERWVRERIFAAHDEVRWNQAVHPDGRFVAFGFGEAAALSDAPEKRVTITRDVSFASDERLVIGQR